MPILYKSSKFRTYSYYFFFPLIIVLSIFMILGILSYGDFGIFNLIMLLGFLFILISATEYLFRLRYIEVYEDHILIKKIKGTEKIEFKNVVYVYDIVSVKGNSLFIWYEEKETEKLKVIFVMPANENLLPKSNYFSLLVGKGKMEITKFIEEKAIKENPEYLNINNPRWFLFSISPTFLSK